MSRKESMNDEIQICSNEEEDDTHRAILASVVRHPSGVPLFHFTWVSHLSITLDAHIITMSTEDDVDKKLPIPLLKDSELSPFHSTIILDATC